MNGSCHDIPTLSREIVRTDGDMTQKDTPKAQKNQPQQVGIEK